MSEFYSNQSFEFELTQEEEEHLIVTETESFELTVDEVVEPTEALKQLNPQTWDLPDLIQRPVDAESFKLSLEEIFELDIFYAPEECSDLLEEEKFGEADHEELVPIKRSKEEQVSNLYSKMSIDLDMEEEDNTAIVTVSTEESDDEVCENIDVSTKENVHLPTDWSALESILKVPLTGEDIYFSSETISGEFALDFQPIGCEEILEKDEFGTYQEIEGVVVRRSKDLLVSACFI